MAKSKKRKQPGKRKKRYPPLSKQDKIFYTCIEIFEAILLVFLVFGYDVLAPFFVLKKPDVLAFEERLTVFLRFPLIILWLDLIFNCSFTKIPVIGNKKIDYYNTLNHKFILPLFDNRYKNIENYKKGRRKFLKYSIIYFCVFMVFLSISISGCIGRHEFNNNGIVTYSIFNNVLEEYSYDEVESYSVSADTYYISRTKSLSYRTYDISLTVELSNGDSFSARYDRVRDLYSLEKIDNLLNGKRKIVNSLYLQEFINKHDFTVDELKVLRTLFEA